jgi:glycosyltransferase involved in cell wall biosynthesis
MKASPPAAAVPLRGGKKVLFVTPVAPWKLFGGTATVSKNLIELFSATLDLEVCGLRSDEPGEYPRQENGTTILSGKVPRLARQLRFFFDFSAESFAHRQFQRRAVRVRLARLIAEQRPEFIIFDHIFSSWLLDLVEDTAARVIYIAHDDMVAYADSLLQLQPGVLKHLRFARLRRQYRTLQEKMLRRCDYTLTMTAEDAARLRSTARGPVEIAPLAFSFPKSEPAYDSSFRHLLITGSFDTWEKKLGLTQFLEAVFTPLLRQDPEMRLVIAGRIPEDVRRQMPFREPQVRVVHGPSQDMMQQMIEQASAAAVLDLQTSGLKIKTIEMAAAGLPLVSWAAGLEGTTLVHGESCLRAESTADFIAHLSRLHSEPDLRRKMGTAARAAIQAAFSKEAADARWRASALFAALAGAGALRAAS